MLEGDANQIPSGFEVMHFLFYPEDTGQPVSDFKQDNGTIRTAIL